MEGFEINVSPKTVLHLDILGGFDITETMVTIWVVMLVIIAFAFVFRFVLLKRFKDLPRGFQNIIEMCVDTINNYSKTLLGGKGTTIAAYVFTLAFMLLVSGLVELLGIRAPATDINFTASLAIMTFALIIAYGVHAKGLWGYMKSFGKPMAAIAPVKVLTEIAIPISLASRMFGNMFSGLVVMDLIYTSMNYFAVGIPAVLSIYFNLFHVAMQTYIFLTLSLSFIHEAVE
jgi:F-type H+-transporting ATPase subunit a